MCDYPRPKFVGAITRPCDERDEPVNPTVVAQSIEVGSFRSDGESTCQLKTGGVMVGATLPKGLWRIWLERESEAK